MNRSFPHERNDQRKATKLARALPGALAALALGFSLSSHAAGGGEALDIELPSMRTPVTEASAPVVSATSQANEAYGSADSTRLSQGPLTREEVRESLKADRQAHRTSQTSRTGEALDIELPSMRTPVNELSKSARAADGASAYDSIAATAATQGPLTRAEVREQLKMARLSNTMTPSGEIGDTPEVLQAREDFNALQTEVLKAEYAAQAARDQQVSLAPVDGGEVVVVEEQQIVVAPDMTVGELIGFLQDSSAEGTVYVMLPGDDEADED